MATSQSWEDVYTDGSRTQLWDIGRPQSAFVRLAERGLLSGRVIDVGCGTGEHALLAGSRGAQAMGIDISRHAIERARGKAAQRGMAADFQVADALSLWLLGRTFDTVIDSGTFHTIDQDSRTQYASSLASVLEPGGMCYLLCMSDRQEGDFHRPRKVSRDDLRSVFRDDWLVQCVEPEVFELNPGTSTTALHAWLATIRRL